MGERIQDKGGGMGMDGGRRREHSEGEWGQERGE